MDKVNADRNCFSVRQLASPRVLAMLVLILVIWWLAASTSTEEYLEQQKQIFRRQDKLVKQDAAIDEPSKQSGLHSMATGLPTVGSDRNAPSKATTNASFPDAPLMPPVTRATNLNPPGTFPLAWSPRKCYKLSSLDGSSRPLPGSENVSSFETTVVTAYFRLNSKHSTAEYDKWMSYFLQMDSPMVIFVSTEDTANRIASLRPATFHNITYFCLVSLYDTESYTRFGHDTWTQQYQIDQEREIHKHYLLYLVWLAKAEFVVKTMELNPFNSKYFVWQDIGMLRDPLQWLVLRHGFPDSSQIRKYCSHEVMMILLNPDILKTYCNLGEVTTPEAFRLDKRFQMTKNLLITVIGGGFCGTADAMRKYYAEFTRVLQVVIQAGTFGGKDQTVMAIVGLQRPDLVKFIVPRHPKGNEWFYWFELFEPGATTSINRATCN